MKTITAQAKALACSHRCAFVSAGARLEVQDLMQSIPTHVTADEAASGSLHLAHAASVMPRYFTQRKPHVDYAPNVRRTNENLAMSFTRSRPSVRIAIPCIIKQSSLHSREAMPRRTA
ncbi:uncharacterized protein UHOD_12235 [Ustilago sp. UG-2017b]|nr:uncharacterized protein UHOD_12235 [Ustilago sp. UG-2017b]